MADYTPMESRKLLYLLLMRQLHDDIDDRQKHGRLSHWLSHLLAVRDYHDSQFHVHILHHDLLLGKTRTFLQSLSGVIR